MVDVHVIGPVSGAQYVLSDGLAVSANVMSATPSTCRRAGRPNSTTVSGIETIYAGGTAGGSVIVFGGVEIVSGTDIGAQLSGGDQGVYGLALGVTVSGGFQTISAGGTASGTLAGGPTPAYVQVNEGGTALDTTLDSGGGLILFGSALGVTLNAGGGANVYGFASGTVINSGGSAFDSAGGVMSDTTVGDGGTLEIISGGTAIDITLDAGGSLEVLSGGTAEGIITDNGTLTFDIASGDSETFGSGLTGTGSIVVDGGGTLVMSGGDSFAGTLTISSGTLELSSASAGGSGPIVFAGGGGVEGDPTLQIDGTTMPANTISGFSDFASSGDAIDLASIAYDSAGSANLDPADDQLVITENHHTYDLQLAGGFSGEFFHLGPDGSGLGTSVTETSQPCYCPGTLIRTAHGDKPVETLVIGDEVRTASGELRAIRWVGRRSYSGRFALGQKHILPICIRAGAIAENVPLRDLWISPNHAMYLDGVLIEARHLINGISVVQDDAVESIDYVHIELDSHDVIIAEGALSESFVDDDSRGLFHNAHEYYARYPQAPRGPAVYCAPRPDQGYLVETARRRVDARAGLEAPVEPTCATLRGYVDVASTRRIAGWAQNPEHPEAPVCLDVRVGGQLIGQVLANRYREDLQRAGLGSGHHGFELALPAGLAVAPTSVEVRRSLDGVALAFSAEAQRALASGPRTQRRFGSS